MDSGDKFMSNPRKKLKPLQNRGIADISKIRKQYKAGVSILQLCRIWNLPYGTLYRELKGKDKKKVEKG